ncbi:MAG: hypothetical protein QNJ15_13195 [Erythrobacter sp.]|nr:hypothetical protein [Erythrobacter sp.]
MDWKLARILDDIRDNVSRGESNLIVGISGIDASGKTTLAAKLVEELRLGEMPVCLLSIDDFLSERSIRRAGPDRSLSYYERGFEWDTFFGLIDEIGRVQRVDTIVPTRCQETDRIISRQIDIQPPTVVVVEGVFLFKRPYQSLFHLPYWLEIGFFEGLARARARERDWQNYGSLEEIDRQYLNRFYPAQSRHFALDDPKSVAVVLDEDSSLPRPIADFAASG